MMGKSFSLAIILFIASFMQIISMSKTKDKLVLRKMLALKPRTAAVAGTLLPGLALAPQHTHVRTASRTKRALGQSNGDDDVAMQNANSTNNDSLVKIVTSRIFQKVRTYLNTFKNKIASGWNSWKTLKSSGGGNATTT